MPEVRELDAELRGNLAPERAVDDTDTVREGQILLVDRAAGEDEANIPGGNLNGKAKAVGNDFVVDGLTDGHQIKSGIGRVRLRGNDRLGDNFLESYFNHISRLYIARN